MLEHQYLEIMSNEGGPKERRRAPKLVEFGALSDPAMGGSKWETNVFHIIFPILWRPPRVGSGNLFHVSWEHDESLWLMTGFSLVTLGDTRFHATGDSQTGIQFLGRPDLSSLRGHPNLPISQGLIDPGRRLFSLAHLSAPFFRLSFMIGQPLVDFY